MGKSSITPKGRTRRRQSLRFMLATLAVVAWGPLDEVSATTMQGILPPDKRLLHGEFRGIAIDAITYGTDPATNSHAMDLNAPRRGGQKHALEALLAGTQGRQSKQFAMTGDHAAAMVMERYLLDLDEQVTPGRTTQVLYGDDHRQWAASLYHLVPFVDQRDGQDDAARPHAFVKVRHEQPQIIQGDGIGLRSAQVRLGSSPQPLDSNVVGLARGADTFLGQSDSADRSLKPLAALIEAYKRADRADQGEQQLRPGEKCYLPGPLGCSPLSTKIGATLVCGLIAWGLIFRVFDLLDRRRRNWLLILPLGLVATTLYVLPSYLVVGFPWDW